MVIANVARAECTGGDVVELASSPSLPHLVFICETIGQIGSDPSDFGADEEKKNIREACARNGQLPACEAAALLKVAGATEISAWQEALLDADARTKAAAELCNDLDGYKKIPIPAAPLSSGFFTYCLQEDARGAPAGPSKAPSARTLHQMVALRRLLAAKVLDKITADDIQAETTRAEKDTFERFRVSGATPPADTPAVAPASRAASVLDTVVGGLAVFLAQRARAEVDQFVLERVRRELCGKPDSLQATLLANTCRFLGDGTFTFSASFGASFQSAVVADVVAFPRNAADYVDANVTISTTEALMARLTLEIAVSLLEDGEALDILSRLDDVLASQKNCATSPCSDDLGKFKTAVLLARALAVHASTLEAPPNAAAVDAIVRGIVPTIDAEQLMYARQASAHLYQLQGVLREMSRTTAKPEKADDGTKSDSAPTEPVDARAHFVEPVARHLIAAINFTFRSLGFAQRISTDIPGVLASLAARQPEQAAARALRLVGDELKAIKTKDAAQGLSIPEPAVRIIALGADLAAAPDKDAAATVIDQFSAPVGSWHRKEHEFTVALNGMVGVGAAFAEMLKTAGTESRSAFQFAPVGMVGLDIAAPFRPHDADGSGSYGIFMSLVDLGAMLDFSSSTPQSDTSMMTTKPINTKKQLEPLAIFAPGVFLRFGIPTTPLVLLLPGVSFQPRGASFEYTDATGATFEEAVPVVRLQAVLAADITIWPF